MGKILDQSKYPLDLVVSKDDFLIGSDYDNNLKTVNFSVGSIIRLVNSELNQASVEYRFSDGTDPDVTADTEGFFLSDSVTPAQVTKLYINKKTQGAQDMSNMLLFLSNNKFGFGLKFVRTSDPSDSFYFKSSNVVDQGNYYEVDVEVIGSNYPGSLVDLSLYNTYLEMLSTQDNKFMVKSASVTGTITTTNAATAINNLATFSVSDEQIVVYKISSDNGEEVTYLPIGLGKGTYGTGGTQLAGSDLQHISSGGGGMAANVVTKEVSFSGAYDLATIATAINNLPAFSLNSGSSVYFLATSDTGMTYVLIGKLGAGDYGTGGTAVASSDLVKIAEMGHSVTNIVKAVTITGDPTESAVATGINNLASFTIKGHENVYFDVTNESSVRYLFIMVGKKAGTYGTGGIQLTGSDLKLIEVSAGTTSWKLKVGGVDKKTLTLGGSLDLKQSGYAVVQYTADGVVTISTSEQLQNLLDSFKPTVFLTKTQYDTLKADGQLNSNTVYLKSC